MATPVIPYRTSGAERVGAILIGVGVVQFVAAMAWVQTAYSNYSLLQNYISDLGNTVTSPLHGVFNVSIILFGVLAILGILLAWGAFPPSGTRPVGLPLLLIASVAAILVGLYPENVNSGVHDLASLVIFLAAGLAIAILAGGMRAGTPWASLRWVSLVLGLITLGSLAYYAPTQISNTTFDPGLIERLIVVPILLWALCAMVVILRLPSRPRLAI